MAEQETPKADDKPDVTETISETPPPLPGDHIHSEVAVTIEEIATPGDEDGKTAIVSSFPALPRKFKHKVLVHTLIDDQPDRAEELERMLDELGAQGFEVLPEILHSDVGKEHRLTLILKKAYYDPPLWGGFVAKTAAQIIEQDRQEDIAVLDAWTLPVIAQAD